jgi:hypothetical protein
MYGIEDKKVFVAHIQNKKLFEVEGVTKYTYSQRCRWDVKEEITVNFNGNATSCKLVAKCKYDMNQCRRFLQNGM